MAVPKSALTLWSQYFAARLAEMCFVMRPAEANVRTAGWLGRQAYRLSARHRARAMHNLNMAFPLLSPAQRADIARGSFEHLFKLLAEIAHTPRMLHRDSWPRRARFNIAEIAPVVELLNAGKPVLMLTGHFGNWEVLGTLLAMFGYPVHAVARPLDNRLVNDWLTGIRERHGLKLITKTDATDHMIAALNGGGALGFIADQNAGERGVFVPFFGRLASTFKSIGLLAISRNLPIICGYTIRASDRIDYEVGATDIIRPQDWRDQPDPLFYVTARYTRAIETMVRRNPTQYLWAHRRWKSRPRWEREGRPMPDSHRAKLQTLPWLDAKEIDEMARPMPAYSDARTRAT